MTTFCNIGFLSGQEEDLQDTEDELHGFISSKHFKQTVTGQNDEPADTRATSAAGPQQSLVCCHSDGRASPVAGCELTPPQVRGGDDAAAFVLTVPNGSGHLQHTQHPPVPERARRASGDAKTGCRRSGQVLYLTVPPAFWILILSS